MHSRVAQACLAHPCPRVDDDGKPCGGSLFPGADSVRCLSCGRPADRQPPQADAIPLADVKRMRIEDAHRAAAISAANNRRRAIARMQAAKRRLDAGEAPSAVRRLMEASERTWHRWTATWRKEQG